MSTYPTTTATPSQYAGGGSLARSWSVHVVLPAYNEAHGLSEMLPELQAVLGDAGIDYRVTVVDDGSSDDTAEVVLQAGATLPVRLISHQRNQGLAAAIRTGLSAACRSTCDTDGSHDYLADNQSSSDDVVASQTASADSGEAKRVIVVTMDSDNTHPIGLIPRMTAAVAEGHDIVIASRFRSGARVLGVSRFRQLTSIGAAGLFKLLFPIYGVRDYTCGFRAYRQTTLQHALDDLGDQFVTEKGFTCMVDLLLKLQRYKPIVGELPMILRYDLKHGASKMSVGSTIRDSLRLAVKRRLGYLN